MKKLLMILLVLVAISSKAEWVRGTITYYNGEEQTGYIKNLKSSECTSIEFKRKTTDEPSKIEAEVIKELILRLKEGTLVLKYLYTSCIALNGEYKPSKTKSWLRVVFRGDFDVLSFYTNTFRDADYYINWPGEDQACMIYIMQNNGLIGIDKNQLLKKSMASIFDDRCNSMLESIEKGEFVPMDIHEVLRFYVDNCKLGTPPQAVVD